MSPSVRSAVASMLLASFTGTCVFAVPRSARADVTPSGPAAPAGATVAGGSKDVPIPVHVIAFDSDDDSEDQADALTRALKTRIRDSRGYAALDTPQKLGTLIVGLKCPPKPDIACLARIAEHVKAERFIWGSVSRGAGRQVVAEIHLWQRGRNEAIAKETYSDNLRDPADDALKRVASRIFDTLAGLGHTGFLSLTSNADGTVVVVDGVDAGEVHGGSARLEVSAGDHLVSLRRANTTTPAKHVAVEAGTDTLVNVPFDAYVPTDDGGSNAPVRKIVGYTTMGVGAVLVGVGIYNGARFISLRNDFDAFSGNIPSSVTDVCAPEFDTNPNAREACTKYIRPAKQARTLTWVFTGIGAAAIAAGLVVVLTDPGNAASDSKPADPKALAKPKVRFLPTLSPAYSGFDVVGSF
ncbi:MAG: hypothetical protein U0169_01520 [Polyangiaceae bacterium]